MQDYRKLEAWQKSHAMALHTYAKRRASLSIPANNAEGCYRGQRSLAHSLRIALGSASELEYYVILAGDLKLLSEAERSTMAKEISDVKAVVTGLLKSVSASLDAAQKGDRKR